MEVPIEKTTTSLSQKCVQMQLPTPFALCSTEPYQYSPLKHDRDIRLLYLLPGSGKAPLSCSLRIVSLLELPVYEAISYTWGEPIFSASIECFSKGQLPITENLSKALFHLRLADRIRVLWVDAICINQQDLIERSHQVTLLRDTFERAENVIVWLGEDTGDANEAFEILRSVGSSSTIYTAALVVSERGKALRKLLGRSWFRRIWVVQELICARKATITCGNHTMDWEIFLELAGIIKQVDQVQQFEDWSVLATLFTLVCMKVGRQRRKQKAKTTLEQLLYNYRSCLASDPRDKVFALVGMASGPIAAAYTPNYSTDVFELYRNLAVHLIIAERNSDVLVHCADLVGSKWPLLPSWVPDWSQTLSINCSPIFNPGAYNAAAGTSFKGRVNEDLDELFLDGVILSNVEVVGSAWSFGAMRNHPKNLIKRRIELNEEYLDMFRQSPRYRDCYWSAFTRALVADKDHIGSRVCQRDLSRIYVTWRKYTSQCLSSHHMIRRCRYFGELVDTLEYQEIHNLELAMDYAACGRTFCLFDDGRAGWLPATAEVGDRVAIFLGATVPILLRPRDNGYIVLGEAYVHEMMDGQAFEGPDVQIETITLI